MNQHARRAFFRQSALACSALATALLVGCAGSGRTVTGRVLEGRASVVMVVDGDDPRFAAPTGVADVAVRVTRGDGTATSLAQATTGSDGWFTLHVEDRYLYNRLELVAQGPAVLTCRGSVYLPTDDRQVLVLVEPANPHGVGERDR